MTAHYKNGTQTVSDTAAVLVTDVVYDGGMVIQNNGPVSIFLGESTVTADRSSTGGLEVEPGEKFLTPYPGAYLSLYAVAESGASASVTWLALRGI